jgi:hypothetical protein
MRRINVYFENVSGMAETEEKLGPILTTRGSSGGKVPRPGPLSKE